MNEPIKIYFVVRADEKGPPSGPLLNRERAEMLAAAHQDDAWVIEVQATATFVARPDGGRRGGA